MEYRVAKQMIFMYIQTYAYFSEIHIMKITGVSRKILKL